MLTDAVVSLAAEYGRYGYRRITALLRAQGWRVNAKRVERIWRREGLKVPRRQPKRGRLWLNDGSCVRLRPSWPRHVWAYDFVQDRTHDGRRFRMLTVIDEYTRECLAIVVARRLRSDDVLQALSELFVQHGPPDHIRSDNGPEFVAKVVRGWLGRLAGGGIARWNTGGFRGDDPAVREIASSPRPRRRLASSARRRRPASARPGTAAGPA